MSPLCLATLFIALCCASCSQDPKLVEKRERQKAEIARLNSELAEIQDKIRSMPPDVAEELANAKKHAEEQDGEVARLEAEIAGLTARKRALQDDYDSYRAKYQLK